MADNSEEQRHRITEAEMPPQGHGLLAPHSPMDTQAILLEAQIQLIRKIADCLERIEGHLSSISLDMRSR